MTSTRIKTQARAIQRANPGMKYTEALRLAQHPPVSIDPMSKEPALADILRVAGHDATSLYNITSIKARAHLEQAQRDAARLRQDPTSTQYRKAETPSAPHHDAPTYADILRAAGVEHTPINLHPGQTGTLDPFALAERPETADPTQRIQLDEWHSMAPSADSMARLNELLRMGRSVPRRHLQLQTPEQMADLLHKPSPDPYAGSKRVGFPTVDAGNIFVWGTTGTGRTTALRALASHALDKGWRVSVADVKDDGYADFLDSSVRGGRVVTSRGHRSLDQGWGLRFVTEGEGNAMDFIASLEPSTAQDPHLVVIDEGQGLLLSHNLAYEGGEWMKNLHRLLADPHTVVAFQSGAGGGLPSDDFISLFESRLMYGRHEAETWELGFRDVAPDSAFDAFTFNASPQGSDLIHGHSRGIFWNGERLSHVAPEDTLPPAKG